MCNLEEDQQSIPFKYQILMQLCYNVPKKEETSCHPNETQNMTQTED